jgi:hypothetical protein
LNSSGRDSELFVWTVDLLFRRQISVKAIAGPRQPGSLQGLLFTQRSKRLDGLVSPVADGGARLPQN